MNSDKVVGLKFEDLSEEQMTHIAGGNGNERITPTVTTVTPYTPYIASASASGAVSAVSGLISYTKKCI